MVDATQHMELGGRHVITFVALEHRIDALQHKAFVALEHMVDATKHMGLGWGGI